MHVRKEYNNMKKFEIELWFLTVHPEGDVYRKLIRTLIDYSDKFYFVTRKELKYDKKIIKQFEPYIINKYKTKVWAGTITLGPAATVYEIKANEETYLLLSDLANSLYEWVAPNLPEDLTFMKNDFTWFFTTTHEEFAAFQFRSEYYKNLVFQIEGLSLEKEE